MGDTAVPGFGQPYEGKHFTDELILTVKCFVIERLSEELVAKALVCERVDEVILVKMDIASKEGFSLFAKMDIKEQAEIVEIESSDTPRIVLDENSIIIEEQSTDVEIEHE